MRLRRTAQPRPWDGLRVEHPQVAARLDDLAKSGNLGDVDIARAVVLTQRLPDSEALHLLPVADQAPGNPAVRQRDLPVRLAQHNVLQGQVRLGRVHPDSRSDLSVSGDFAIDLDVLRTSLLVIGPPGSGKTRGIAIPIVEHLSLAALAGRASVVVIDPKGDDFDHDGWFDITIDPLNPTHGLSLYSGATTPDMAADRLASALLPPKVSDDKAYFVDASKNALYACLAPFHAALGRWPHVGELLGLLRGEQADVDRVKSQLHGPDARDLKRLLDTRTAHLRGRVDPAASILERLALLNRPTLTALFDHPKPFNMADINQSVRVRIVLPEAEFPDASRIIARLVVAQFVQITSSARTDRSIFKCLVMDEAGRFIDDYVARGIQRVRSNNAGMVLLSQSLGDFPRELRPTIFGSTGCKAVFGGIDPADAKLFSSWFGDQHITQTTVNRGANRSQRYNRWGLPDGASVGQSASRSTRQVERARWSVSDIVTGIPHGACLTSLSRSDGTRVGPVLVNLRG